MTQLNFGEIDILENKNPWIKLEVTLFMYSKIKSFCFQTYCNKFYFSYNLFLFFGLEKMWYENLHAMNEQGLKPWC